ncbi:MAG: hypothetical protein LBH48_03265 [Bifidobacteriaceae bacterium]|nr:hypothetical protein [Bifidobacteriaceae bacterium]
MAWADNLDWSDSEVQAAYSRVSEAAFSQADYFLETGVCEEMVAITIVGIPPTGYILTYKVEGDDEPKHEEWSV